MSKPENQNHEEILTIREVAQELRCSKAHVYKVILGCVSGVEPLPSIPLGRRKLVRRGSLEEWKRRAERCVGHDNIPASLKIDAVGA